MARLIGSAPSLCRDVLDPDFAVKNAPFGYDPNYNYAGSDYIKQHYGIALKRFWFGVDLNPCFWLHDRDFERGLTIHAFDDANDTMRDNIAKSLRSHGHRIAALFVGWFHWLGVESLPALIDYLLCKKD